MKNITISDVAEALGVSKTTVSRAISGKGRISSQTRERVIAYIEEHGYKPNVIAKSLAQSKTYNIGVIMPAEYDIIDLPFFQSCLFGIQEIAASKDYDILLTICPPKDTAPLERIIANRKVDGIILMRTFVKDSHVKLLSQKNMPFITIGSTQGQSAVQVDQDHQNACRDLTSLLLNKGFTKIALIGGNENHVVNQSRLAGYREAFQRAGLPLREDFVYLNMNHSPKLTEQTEDILSKGAEAIVCMDDSLCTQVLKALRKKKAHIPEDIKIASFYNSTVLENYTPSITSLSFDEKELGRAACKKLMEIMEGNTPRKLTVLGYQILLGESTE